MPSLLRDSNQLSCFNVTELKGEFGLFSIILSSYPALMLLEV